MGDARWNDDGGIVRPAVVVAIDKKSHCTRWQTAAGLAQDHLGPALYEKHHVPLLVFVAAKGKILRFIDEKTAKPFGGRGVLRHAWRMDMETLRSLGEHPGS